MTVGVIRRAVVVAVIALALTGCGSTSLLPGHHHTVAVAQRDGPAASAAALKVINGWSTALRNGDLQTAAHYFHLPSVFANGGDDTFEIHTLAQAVAANAALPCGATFVSAFQDGPYVNALFRLGDRQGAGGGSGSCGSGTGTTARVRFIVVDGQITHWLRAPSLPNDPQMPTTPDNVDPDQQTV